MIHMAFDPGAKGGIAIQYNCDKGTVVLPMPLSGKSVNLRSLMSYVKNAEVTVYIERVHSMPKQGVASTFKFGMNYGKIIGMCQAMGWRYHFVTPQKWKAYVLAGTKRDKDAAITTAKQLFPDINLVPEGKRKEHDGIADALCILYYGMNML